MEASSSAGPSGSGSNHESLKCPNCKYMMVPPIYQCRGGHPCCEDCKTQLCVICEKLITSTKRTVHLENQAPFATYPCRWQAHCGGYTYDTIREHEAACVYRVYKCPVITCQFSGSVHELPTHMRTTHPHVQFHVLNRVTQVGGSERAWYMLAYHEVFECKFLRNRNALEWTVTLHADHNRGRTFFLEVETCHRLFTMELINYFWPRYELEVPYSELNIDWQCFTHIMRIYRKSSTYIEA